jgi:hypothetical protein
VQEGAFVAGEQCARSIVESVGLPARAAVAQVRVAL